MKMQQDELTAALMPLVDKSDVAEVLLALGLLCFEKAEHFQVQADRRSKDMAKPWERAGKAIHGIVARIAV